MALQHARPCEVVNLSTFAEQAREKAANALVKHDAFEAVLMHLSPGETIPAHEVKGPIIVQCLEGAVNFPVAGEERLMRTGDWMYLPGGTPHAIEAAEQSRLLVIILF
jgi:quercetin dioxygenase-like cupin family protein